MTSGTSPQWQTPTYGFGRPSRKMVYNIGNRFYVIWMTSCALVTSHHIPWRAYKPSSNWRTVRWRSRKYISVLSCHQWIMNKGSNAGQCYLICTARLCWRIPSKVLIRKDLGCNPSATFQSDITTSQRCIAQLSLRSTDYSGIKRWLVPYGGQ